MTITLDLTEAEETQLRAVAAQRGLAPEAIATDAVKAVLPVALSVKVPISEAEFEQKLLEAGVISRIPPPITDFAPYQNRNLVAVQGKPISETVIEDRGSC